MSSGVQKEKTAFNGEIMKILKNTCRCADDSERVRYITQEKKREFNEKTKKGMKYIDGEKRKHGEGSSNSLESCQSERWLIVSRCRFLTPCLSLIRDV